MMPQYPAPPPAVSPAPGGGPAAQFGPGGVPAPPPGPGVLPPFAAPPRDQDRRRLWWGLGIGAVILVLVCGGGVVGFGLLASGSEDLLRSQATATVRTYLTAVRAGRYADAYDLLCDDVTAVLSQSGFESRMRDDRLTDFAIGSVNVTNRITVATALRFASGNTRDQIYPLVQSSTALKICGGV